MNEATRIVVQLTANAVKQYNNHVKKDAAAWRDYDERNLATCLAACRTQGLTPQLIRDIDGTVAVRFGYVDF